MENLPNLENCSSECSNPYYIEGPSLICSDGSYHIPGLQRGATVIWSASPAGIATITSLNDLQTTLTKNYDGNITLTATITGACNNTPIHKTIYAGQPKISGGYTDHNGQHPMQYWDGTSFSYNHVCNSYNANTNMSISGASIISWSKVTSSPNNITWNQSGNDISFYFWQINQTAVFEIEASNTCGTTTNTFGFKSINCSGGGGDPCDIFLLSPNPASSTIQVGVHPNIPAPCDNILHNQATEQGKTTGDAKTVNTRNRFVQQVRIFNDKGTLLQQHQYGIKNKKATLNVSRLPAGIYIVRITDGSYTENHRVVIK